MSSQDVKEKMKNTAKSIEELVDSLVAASQREVSVKFPKMVRTLDQSFDEAAKGLKDALNTIDHSTASEQRQLLKAYGSFLGKQMEVVEKRIREIERGKTDSAPTSSGQST